jgi:peptide/nickel transport system substrate-binding protein
MSKKGFLYVLVGLLLLGLLAAGCQKPDDKDPPVPPAKGALIDEVVFTVEESHAAAVRKLQAMQTDIYAFPITNPELYDTIQKDPNLNYAVNYGGYRELRFNTSGPLFGAGELNPFSVAKIREAMNWLIDRKYMVEEHLGGLGTPKWTALGTAFPDHLVRYPDLVKEIETFYAPNKTKAKDIITEEMQKLGAELKDGKWHYGGKPVVLKGLIRSDLPPFPAAGNYVANLLEEIGFEVERMERRGADASPIWIGSHPDEGLWHWYTGGWSSPTISRDGGAIFDQMYTNRVMPQPVFQVLAKVLEEFPALDEASRKLRFKEFSNMEEREALFKTVLWEAMKSSNCIWLMDLAGASPYRSEITLAADKAGGIGDPAWVLTTHRRVDGKPVPLERLKIEVPNLLVDPWNPVDGSAFTYDMLFTRRAVGDTGIVADPRDGLFWPQRAEKAEVTVKTGLPVDKTHDWVTLTFADEIKVPDDAWADWNAKEQKWITAAERFGAGGATAQRKSVIHYPAGIYETPLHDGSKLSLGDFVMAMIVGFDRAKEDSPIFDQSKVAGFNAFLNTFKGVKIVSEKPLVIETYSDVWYMDAEWNVTSWYPVYGTYEWSGYWHMVSVGMLAEVDKALTFSKSKSDTLKVDQMDYTKGPSLPILKTKMDKAAADNFIPYAPTLSTYISADEATARWKNLQDFYAKWGHFWVGSGPYIIKQVRPVEKIGVLERFADYPDASDRWFFFLQPLAQ